MKDGTLLAAVDLGSNSFLLEVAQYSRGRLIPHLQRKETVRLGGALDAQGLLSEEGMERGWDCLARFATCLEGVAPTHRRIVATQTLREAGNRTRFLDRAQALLGSPVELISGETEAALIYQGAARLLPPGPERRLIVDIGGRSTELCRGVQQQLHGARSLPMGSVAWAQRFFAGGRLDAAAFAAAEAAARTILRPALADFGAGQWEQAYGASGTAGAISKALHARGEPIGTIHRTALAALRQDVMAAGHMDRLQLDGLRDELRPVIGAGISLMWTVCELLDIAQLRTSKGALRHGLLYSMLPSTHPPRSLEAGRALT